MLHTQYADGTPRPLTRGWLHLIAAVLWSPQLLAPSTPAPARVILCSMAAVLWASAALHTYPWRSAANEELMYRLDRAGIIHLSLWTYLSPTYFGCAGAPGWGVAAGMVVLPNVCGLLATAAGSTSRLVFLGAATGHLAVATAFRGEPRAADAGWWAMLPISFYAVSLAIHKVCYGAPARYWGYHEWMHALVLVAFYCQTQYARAIAAL